MTSTSLFFETFLKQKKISYQTKPLNNLTIYIFEHTIPYGKYTGQKVEVGLPIPSDFEVTPPYGFHIKKNHGFEGKIPNVNASPLGDEWEFWSRQIQTWNATNKAQYYFDYVNRWLEL